MAGAREIIEVLHFVGAADSFIARQFQGHFLRLGLRGAAIGGVAAALFFGLGALLSRWCATRRAARRSPRCSAPSALGAFGYAAIVVVCLAIAVLTGFLSRQIVFRHLRGLL